MTRLRWEGKACGANRRLMPGRGGRFFLNPAYRKCKESMTATFLGRVMVYGDVHLEIRMKIGVLMDSDALLKVIFDSLQAAGVLENDRQIRSYNVRRENRKREEPDSLEIEVVSLCAASN